MKEHYLYQIKTFRFAASDYIFSSKLTADGHLALNFNLGNWWLISNSEYYLFEAEPQRCMVCFIISTILRG